MKSFEEYLTEVTQLIDGVTLTKRPNGHKIQHNGQMKDSKEFDVHLHGHHIGHVAQYVHRPHKKIAGSRLVKPMAEKIAWSAHTTHATSEKHGVGFFRSSSTMGSHHQHDAANSLARHYIDKIKKDE